MEEGGSESDQMWKMFFFFFIKTKFYCKSLGNPQEKPKERIIQGKPTRELHQKRKKKKENVPWILWKSSNYKVAK